MIGAFRIGRILGFEIRIDLSWFLVFGLVVWTFSANEFPRQLPGYAAAVYYAMGIIGALVFFLSVVLHELAHAVMARARGIEVEGITLFIFGGVAQTRQEPERALDEFLLTIVGPLMSFALFGAFYLLADVAASAGWPPPFVTVAGFLAWLNLILAVFNMVPGFPLDGGRVFRSAVWAITGDLDRATRWATWGGRLLGYLLIAYGGWLLLQGALIPGLWSVFIGWFLSNAAKASYRQFTVRRTLSRVQAFRIMMTDPVVVDPELPVRRLIEEYFVRRADGAYPVVREGELVGLVSVEDAAKLDEDARSTLRVADIMRPASEVPQAGANETLDLIVSRLDPGKDERILIVENGILIGLISLGDIGLWVKRARALGLDEPQPNRG